MSAARTAILARLASAQRTARLPPPPSVERPETASRSREECLARFRSELAALGVECHVEASAAAVRARVQAVTQGGRVLCWDPACLPYEAASGLPQLVPASGPLPEQAQAEFGLTGCEAAIAETGSLVVLSGQGRSRTASLLPPVHVAVVRPEDLCFSMAEFFRSRAQQVAGSASCTFITGPSRTADIELTLTLGVHGPGRVVVIVGPAA
jgi:L-lactate dehydrogenase complex protein LldG